MTEHLCAIVASCAKPAAGGGELLEFELEILEGADRGRRFVDRVMLRHPTDCDALKVGRQRLAEICRAVGVLKPGDSMELHGRPFLASIGDAGGVAGYRPAAPSIADRDGDPISVRLADVTPEITHWLWPQRIPRGELTIFAGRAGDGKSLLTMDWAARVSRGGFWPDGAPCRGGSVIIVSGEDSLARTIRPRLDRAKADLDRIEALKAKRSFRGDGQEPLESGFTLDDLRPLQRMLDRMQDCGLVIIDPIGSYIGGQVDAHRDNEVRGVLAPLATMAHERDVAIVLVAHQRKAHASHADDLVMGSRAFTGIVRSVLHLMVDPDDRTDPPRRLLLPGKNNLSKPAPGLAFRIEGGPTDAARVVWDDAPVTRTANEILAASSRGEDLDKPAQNDAEAFLAAELAAGPVAAKEIRRRAKDSGIKDRTLDRAKATLGVMSELKGFGSEGVWQWHLPQRSQCAPINGVVAHSGQTAQEGALLPF